MDIIIILDKLIRRMREEGGGRRGRDKDMLIGTVTYTAAVCRDILNAASTIDYCKLAS